MSNDKQGPSNPGELFISLWLEACAWSGPERARAPSATAAVVRKIKNGLGYDRVDVVMRSLANIVSESRGLDIEVHRGNILGLMLEIDQWFARIHPRTMVRPASDPLSRPIPRWLKDHRNQRTRKHVYAESSDNALVPRGPLNRAPRPETASYADSLYDRFQYLSVISKKTSHQGRSIDVRIACIGSDAGAGVSKPTSDRIVFFPVITKGEEIIFEDCQRGSARMMSCKTNTSRPVSEIMFDAIKCAGDAAIAFAPEFVIDHDQASALADLLRKLPESPALTLAGSGLSPDTDGHQHWNQAHVYNKHGALLWSQRKIWPANIDREMAQKLGLQDPGPSKQVAEDTAAGSEIVVADIDTVGRCVILICQDIKARPIAPDIIEAFQPDWVFVPILDRGVGPARWMQIAPFEHSDLGQARFLVVTSLAIGDRLKSKDNNFAMALGPRDLADDPDQAFTTHRAIKVLPVAQKSGNSYAELIWETDTWAQTDISISPWPI